MKIGIGSDHNAFDMKEKIKQYVEQMGHEVIDFGCHSCEATDYPDVAFEVAAQVSQGQVERGILICGTGIGVAIAAGKYPGIRAALCHDTYSAERAQLSNNAQIITMGAQIIGLETAKKVVEAYLNCTFDENGRSSGKVQKIINREKEILEGNFGSVDLQIDTTCS